MDTPRTDARLLDGKAIAAAVRVEVAAGAADFAARAGRPASLGVVLVGDNSASRSYVTGKEKACAECGLASRELALPATASFSDVLAAVHALNADPAVDGILVQLPLPDPRMEQAVIEAIDPAKDVDGFHPLSMGRLLAGLPTFVPCTPLGIMEILARSGIPTRGAHAVIVGRSHIVGRPLSILLSRKPADATVTLCHTATRDLADFTRSADILVAAVGRPLTITADMVRPGATVIDVGVNRIPDPSRPRGYRLVGDIDYPALLPIASAITPVPGGVGPMTITMLLSNTLLAANRRTANP
ncbi:MAG: bifunctional 5,10-methylenetetrahydrofolate dehydrogenase/5,10-methenyltetrahydrofolate cyclohydrolase [Kiritimatiellae bacterium]|nr:bifunctional 5,10-methylenetetrahydrofolate dehydrogenase/5,10-methenyltetrahydrofolate cyclohydrolase [Kiritimatiellia bacterium]